MKQEHIFVSIINIEIIYGQKRPTIKLEFLTKTINNIDHEISKTDDHAAYPKYIDSKSI